MIFLLLSLCLAEPKESEYTRLKYVFDNRTTAVVVFVDCKAEAIPGCQVLIAGNCFPDLKAEDSPCIIYYYKDKAVGHKMWFKNVDQLKAWLNAPKIVPPQPAVQYQSVPARSSSGRGGGC